MAGGRYPIEMVRGVPVVAAPEEIDVRNADWLEKVLLQAHHGGHGTFVVDMTGTRFCASAGLGVLVRAHNRALAQGGELRLVIPASAMVLRMFAMSGLDQVIPNFPGLDEALAPTPRRPPPTVVAAPAAAQAGDAPPRRPAANRSRRGTQPRLSSPGSGARPALCESSVTAPAAPRGAFRSAPVRGR
jgi:anti-sigma B factor antagonist